MSYKIVATKEDGTMRWARQSLLIAAAKARVWTSEGWQVVVTDGEGRTLDWEREAQEGLQARRKARRVRD